jgi:D-alanyl-D-alanine endopeptidase (penicillin-binding protein 7)
VRLVRPIVTRLVSTLLGVAICLPVSSAAAATAQKRPATRRATTASSSTTPRRKPATAYSARASSARRTNLARARASARAREQTRLHSLAQLQEAMTPQFKTDATGAQVPDVRAAAAIIFDPATGQVLYEENSQDKRSIASITKVMTATVFLENSPDLTEPVTVQRSDVFQASTTHLHANDKVTTDDLLHLLLIASDNAAARALARVSPFGSEGFIRRMNEKADELGLQSTHYADPSGLLSENVSSAYDMARLITHASQDERISSIMRTNEYTVYSGKRPILFHSTNHLLREGNVDVRAGKTGFITKAGYCLATVLRLQGSSQDVAVVVFGARSNAGRFMESRNLFNWVSSKASTLFAAKPTTEQQQQQQQ